MMFEVTGLLQLTLLVLLGFIALSSLGAGVLLGIVSRRLGDRSPEVRARALLVYAASPLAGGLLLVLLSLAPSVVALVADARFDHCLAHDDHHAHLCLIHRPAAPGGRMGWIVLAVAALGGFGVLARDARTFVRSERTVRALLATAQHDATRDVDWLGLQEPIALTTGIGSPRVLLSESLRDVLPPALLDIVVAHENAHRVRRDPSRLWFAACLARLQLPGVRRRLLGELRLACEQAADEAAARACGGDRLLVADAVLAMERLSVQGPAQPPWAFAFGGSNVRARVERLLSAPLPDASPATSRWLTGALVAAGILAEPLHHLAETLVTPLVR